MPDKLTIRLKIVSPERVLFDDEVNEVVMNTKQGQITVLPNHVPLISILTPGEVLIRKEADLSTQKGSTGAGDIPLVISGGFVEVVKNQVVILADTAEHIQELDLERAQKAIELAEQLLKDKKFDVKEYESMQYNLKKHRSRVSAFTKWRK